MADFCRQCSLEHFDRDFGDLRGLSKPEDTARKLYAPVLCEGCEFIFVDHLGVCVSENCLEEHRV